MNLPWFKNSDGKKDAMLSFAVVGFGVVIVKVLLGGGSFQYGAGHVFTFGAIDATVIAAILGPTLGSYVMRRHTDAKFDAAAEEAAPSDPTKKNE